MSFLPTKNTKFNADVVIETAAEGDNDTSAASTAYVDRAVGSVNMARPAARIRQTTAQSIPNGAWTKLTYQSELSDTDAMANLGTNADRLTCVTPGTYDVKTNISFTSHATGVRGLRLVHRNSSGTVQAYYAAYISSAPTTGQLESPTSSAHIPMVAGDYVEAEVYQTSGAALLTLVNYLTDHSSYSVLSAAWVGGTGAAWGNAAARLSRRTDQSVASGSWVTVDMQSTADFDTAGMTLVADRITITTPGVYDIAAHAVWVASAGGTWRGARIMKNGGVLMQAGDTPSTAKHERLSISIHDTAVVGDYYELQVIQDTGAALVLTASTEYSYLSAVRVGYQTNPSTPPVGKAYLSTAANHTSIGNWQKVPIATIAAEAHDGVSAFDAANNRMVCRKAGYYQLNGHVGFTGSSAFTGLGGVSVRINGGGYETEHFTIPGYFYHGCKIFTHMAVGDYAELWCYQPSFASVGYAANVETNLSWQFIRAT